jgi:hypothetical protein
MKYLAMSLLLLTVAAMAQTTPNLGLNIPLTGTLNWGPILNFNFSLLDTKLACFGTASIPGTIAYFNGTAWLCLAGNTSGTKILQENSSGVISWSTAPTTLTLQTNGIANSSQTVLNLQAGSNVTLTDAGSGTIQIASTGGGSTAKRCEAGLGDGLNVIVAGTYLQYTCYNDTAGTWTLTGFRCNTDNNGSSTMNATNSAGTGLLTSSITCTNTFASGTQSATTTLAAGDYIKFTFVSDGASKQTTWVVSIQ